MHLWRSTGFSLDQGWLWFSPSLGASRPSFLGKTTRGDACQATDAQPSATLWKDSDNKKLATLGSQATEPALGSQATDGDGGDSR